MARKLPDSDRQNAVKLYRSGLSGSEVARRTGHCLKWVNKVVAQSGATRSLSEARYAFHARGGKSWKWRKDIQNAKVKALYESGESAREIGESCGLNPSSVIRRLHKMDVRLRHGAETWLPLLRKKTSAAIAESRSRKIGWGEKLLHQWLVERGENPEFQKPAGAKNVDIAIGTVAVEIWLSSSNPFTDPYCRERIKYLANLGWTSCYVFVSRRTKVLVPSVADKVVAVCNGVRANPTAPRKHWVIRGCGELAASAGDDLDYGTVIPTSKDCPHHSTVNHSLRG